MILGLFSLLATGMYAQVRGTVKDSTGEPVPGANVFWMNTGQGVTTKVDGPSLLRSLRKAIYWWSALSAFRMIRSTLTVKSRNWRLSSGTEWN